MRDVLGGRLPEYVLGILPPAEMEEIRRLVIRSPALQGEVDQLAAALASMADALPPIAPSRESRRRLLARLTPVAHLVSVADTAHRPRRAPGAITAIASLTLAGGLAVAALNWPLSGSLAERAPGLALLLFAQVAGLWAALAPGRSPWAIASWASAGAGALMVLATRSAAGDVSGWICSLSQTLAGLAPLVLVVSALRRSSRSWQRSLTAGMAVGTTGVIWGEIACQRGLLHVIAHHGGVWLVLLAGCVLGSRVLRGPSSFLLRAR